MNNTTGPLEVFQGWYHYRHGYISLVVCFFGIISNIVNIVVLLQKNMINPFNFLLVGVAIADIVTMVSYVPYAAYYYIYSSILEHDGHPYGWIAYLILSNALILTSHTVALWLTVSLAVFRYIVVCHHVHGPRLCNISRAKLTTLIVTIASVVTCIPNDLNHDIETIDNGTLYTLGMSYVNVKTNEFWFKFTLWLYVVFFKVAPCTFLLVLSALLINTMKTANQRRMRLFSSRHRVEAEHSNEHNRTTNMLVVVVVFFALADLPQGILAFWAMLSEHALANYYTPLGDIFDILVLINSAVNFILYCIMSQQFRTTFTNIILSKVCRATITRGKVVTANGMNYTTVATETTQAIDSTEDVIS